MEITKDLVIGVLVIGIVFGGLMLFNGNSNKNVDKFAQCLSKKDVKMYGAYWCPHCKDQKEKFGSSFEKVNYVECSFPDKGTKGQNKKCKEENIQTYPTWEFQNGERVQGVLSLEQISQYSGCKLE